MGLASPLTDTQVSCPLPLGSGTVGITPTQRDSWSRADPKGVMREAPVSGTLPQKHLPVSSPRPPNLSPLWLFFVYAPLKKKEVIYPLWASLSL